MIVAGLAAFFSQRLLRAPENAVLGGDASESGAVLHSTDLREFAEEARLQDAAGGLSFGLATKRAIGSEFFIIVAAQLDQPQKDYFYQAWFARKAENESEVISLGKMERSGETKIWQAVFRTSSPPPEYNEIWITVEQKEDDSPERVILKGTF